MATKYVVAARHDENGGITGGKAGDQTGEEVMVHTLTSSGSWDKIYRAPSGADTIVRQAYAAAANDNIGYDQNERTTLYTQAKAKAWDLSAITTACECDCSSLVAVLVNAAGFAVSKDIYTGNEGAALKAVGFTELDYSSGALEVGDILWRSGHTAVYVGTSKTYSGTTSSGSTEYTVVKGDTLSALALKYGTTVDAILAANEGRYAKMTRSYIETGWVLTIPTSASEGSDTGSTSAPSDEVEDAMGFDSSLAGAYTVTDALNLRSGAGTSKKILAVMPKGATVRNYGYYTDVDGTRWLYVKYGSQTGFASAKWLTK